MLPKSLLIANRGEVAVRVARTAADLGIETVAVHGADDAGSLHVAVAGRAVALPGRGPAAYLDAAAVVAAGVEAGCDALHPGWGFLSESAAFARACTEAGLTWVGPRPEVLEAFGDKAATRVLAGSLGIPVPQGTTDQHAAAALLASLGPDRSILLKAVAGGGGRGMRVVSDAADLHAAWERASAEATAAFGDGRLYVEELLPAVRHVEVQLVGDGTTVVALGERECSLQRRHQKLVEIAPSPWLTEAQRATVTRHASTLGEAVRLDGVVTVELLVALEGEGVWLIEANPRLQVEHTVTEAVLGIDLVAVQLALAAGSSLADAGLASVPAPRGVAIQARVTATAGGTLRGFAPPAGPGVRVDAGIADGHGPNPAFDPLLAKVVAHGDSWERAQARVVRALTDLRVDGIPTDAALLVDLLTDPSVLAGRAGTTFVESRPQPEVPAGAEDATAPADHGDGRLRAPLPGTVVQVLVAAGAVVGPGTEVLVLESMKLQHGVVAPAGGVVRVIRAQVGDVVAEGDVLVELDPLGDDADVAAAAAAAQVDLDHIRPDLAEVLARQHLTTDAARPQAVARRESRGQRTVRHNLAELVDEGSFVEYGALVIAGQRRRRTMDDLIHNTPADGMLCGTATVEGRPVALAAYDATVLAGTQGGQNHRKKDRIFELAERRRLPFLMLAEGGGGRPGDTDGSGVSGLDCLAFQYFGRLSGKVPLIGVTSGRCFAGNAALLGCCDVIIAAEGSNIGMGGPAMIEGGGLGVYAPEDVGPLHVQVANGVVDIPTADERDAVLTARQAVGHFLGVTPTARAWEAADQRICRHLVPEDRLRAYDVRRVWHTLFDTGSVLELGAGWGKTMITAFARLEGRPVGVIGNDPHHLGGAIDAAGSRKADRFLKLCDTYRLPVVSLCDTPGIMVGPEAETEGTVRDASRLFATTASLTVPFAVVVLRKAYGLGAQAMAGGSFATPDIGLSWPTGEFGGMGLEGAVRLGYSKELAAAPTDEERDRMFQEMVAASYQRGKALNVASHFEIDDVIDPADTRALLVKAFHAAAPL